jgi:hypothetical protein
MDGRLAEMIIRLFDGQIQLAQKNYPAMMHWKEIHCPANQVDSPGAAVVSLEFSIGESAVSASR